MNNNMFQPYGNFGYGPNSSPQQQTMYGNNTANYVNSQFKTNKIFVINLQDALSRQTEPNSEYVFFDQEKDILYNIHTDSTGKKSWKVIDLFLHKDEEVKQSDEKYDKLLERVDSLEKRLEAMNGNNEQSVAK